MQCVLHLPQSTAAAFPKCRLMRSKIALIQHELHNRFGWVPLESLQISEQDAIRADIEPLHGRKHV
jgi:hypothetical protein